MLILAFEKAANLLSARNYYSYMVIIDFAQKEPETVRHLFKNLFDEEQQLEKRYNEFRNGFNMFVKKYLDETRKNHYQDLHAVSVYLTFAYPEKYFIYKYSIYKNFSVYIGFDEEKKNSEVGKLENYFTICHRVLDVLHEDVELQQLSASRLKEDCYQDVEHHILAMDIIYFGSNLTKENGVKNKELEEINQMQVTDLQKNIILYGPPGTGKTYHSVVYAVAIIENKKLNEIQNENYEDVFSRYQSYKKDGLIEFTTFHQSYGYEEFIEGIKPVMDLDSEGQNEIQYEIKSGIFKSFCEKAIRPIMKEEKSKGINNAPNIWKVSLEGTYDNPTRTECLLNNHIRIGWDEYGAEINDQTDFSIKGGKNVINAFINKMKIGDIVLSCYSATSIDAVGVVTGDYEWHDEYEHYKRLRKVNWLVKNIRESIVEINNGTAMTLSSVYKLNVSITDVMEIVKKYSSDATVDLPNNKSYVFIIDEINRGNISKIFGELITLIEPTKRLGQMEGTYVRLPYSQKMFGVPDNVYVIGTMNTADRSIATIDTALRRRFSFKEMQPNPNVLKDIMVEDISIKDVLITMNKRISVLYDREHTIGHAYFMPLRSNPTIENLANIFENNIIPLLQEYFYEDYEKIRMVLGDNNKDNKEDQFIVPVQNNYEELFGGAEVDYEERPSYEINIGAFDNIEAYRLI